TVGRQVRSILFAPFARATVTAVACQRPPGDALAPAQLIYTEIRSDAIEPGGKIIAVIQIIPGNICPRKYFLGYVVRVFLAAQQTIDIGVNWPAEFFVERAKIRRTCVCGDASDRARCQVM